MNRDDLFNQLIDSFHGVQRGVLRSSDYQKEGIPFGQKAALLTIAVNKTINVKQLAEELHVTSGAATQHVEALVHEGLVVREIDENDRRNVVITLSNDGNKLLVKLRKNRVEKMKVLFSEVSDDELEIFINVMSKVTKCIKQKEEENGKN